MDDRPAPSAGPGDVLVTLSTTGICGTNLSIYSGKITVRHPLIMGHEMCGRVAAAPDAFTSTATANARVVVDPAVCCGTCFWCSKGQTNLCPNGALLGRDRDGGFTEQIAVPAANVYEVPDAISDSAAPLLQVLAVCIHGQRNAPISPGDSVLIIDLGVSGLLHRATAAPPAAQGRLVDIKNHRRGPGHWQVSSINMLLHTGSHVDSTWHVFEDGDVIDCSEGGPREPVDAAMLDKKAGEVRAGDIIVIRTDWTDRSWGDFPAFYAQSPYLTEDGADWLLDRSPKAIIFDFFEEYSAALDDFTSEDFVVHRKLLGAGLPLVEQATNLAALERDRCKIFAPFFRLDEAEAAPCRIFAILDP